LGQPQSVSESLVWQADYPQPQAILHNLRSHHNHRNKQKLINLNNPTDEKSHLAGKPCLKKFYS
jgi:hypothetical protein